MNLPDIIENKNQYKNEDLSAMVVATPQSNWKAYIFYPLALIATLAFIQAEVSGLLGPLGKAYPLYLFILISIMVTFERIAPMRREWNMTKISLLTRDLPMLAFNAAAIVSTT